MIVILLPSSDYDPTEAALPWAALHAAGADVRFATPTGEIALADRRLTDQGFSLLSPVLMTRPAALDEYSRMCRDPHFQSPIAYADIRDDDVSGVFVPGGHAPGMKSMLDSTLAQNIFGNALLAGLPTGAVCHGVLLAARARNPHTGQSVLYERNTTAVTTTLELSAWTLTRPWLGKYYRTYATTVQSEVIAALKNSKQFHRGPIVPRRDGTTKLHRGFTVVDGNYISARWPGDCHRLAAEYRDLVISLT
ncbi:type 1 glutamine amidotransferase domain-containing protein [Rhodococcus qingshengii]|uniref:type 1 glutamine amidotransferase domain-containing protein n=1 Tax=Rhodococcus qingshengii TaxID=334542 RepID=UPI001ADF995B|nr:type 1 glutamine amidotransferase domain-containing protein [Rhodococcus qingshengii]